jgi:Cu-processing system permease protein
VSTNALHVASWTLREAIRRKLVVGLLMLSGVYIGLFALGFRLLYAEASKEAAQGDTLLDVLAANLLTVLGLYAVQFLAAFLALFLSVGSISTEIESGMLHAVLSRPVTRAQYLLGRWLALVGLLVTYVVTMAGALLVIARAVAGYQPVGAARALGMLTLQVLLLITVGLFGSTVLPTMANGVITFSLFGLAWLGGLIEFIGTGVRNDTMANIGTAVGLIFPSDALWRGASYYVQSSSFLAQTSAFGQFSGGIPFAANTPPTTEIVIWAFGYLLVLHVLARATFSRRDL